MRKFLHLLKYDAILFYRNRIFAVAAVVTAAYLGIFYLLQPLGNLTTMLVVLIFNDPVVMGFLFAGVLLLFDKSQNTIQAILVAPVPFFTYILSKTVLLSALATVISFIMAWSTRGNDFNYLPLFISVFLSTAMFSMLGFAISAMCRDFNRFLVYSMGFLIVAAVPFASVFGIGKAEYYSWVPTMGGIWLLESAFDLRKMEMFYFVMYAHLGFWTVTSAVISGFITRQKAI